MTPRRTARAATAAGLCLLLGTITACSTTLSRERDLVRNDPLASATWDGLEVLGTIESDDTELKPSPASMTRCIKMTIPLSEALTRVMTTAKENEWRENKRLASGTSRLARKGTKEGGMKLIISTIFFGCEKKHPETNLGLTITFG